MPPNDCHRNEEADAVRFGQLVRERRTARQWSQEALAAAALLNSERKGYVSEIERGRFPKISFENVKRIALALDIKREEIPQALRWPQTASAPPEANAGMPLLSGQLLEYAEIREATPAERLHAVGSRITWRRLLAGLYMPRPKALSALLAAIEEWRGTIDAILSSGETPIFWIDGLSGDGKSVLLLQAAHLVLSQSDQTAMFHAHSPDTIGDVLQHALHIIKAETLEFVIVDDLHLISDAKALEKELSTFASDGRLRFALLACGPTPERRAFEKLVRDIRVTRFECPATTVDDGAAFARWFGVGQPKIASADNQILVEILFELKAGEPIPAFAMSFGERLRKRDLFNVVTAALAANVFDVLAPIALIDGAKARAAFEELARTDQLHFEVGLQHNVEGFRLVHSRIAWRLFKEWSKGPYTEAAVAPFLAEYLAKALHSAPEGEYTYFVNLMTSISTRLPTLLGVSPSLEDFVEQERLTWGQIKRARTPKFNEDTAQLIWIEFVRELLDHLHDAPTARCYVARFALLPLTAPSPEVKPLIQTAAAARDDVRAHPAARMNIAAALGRVNCIQPAEKPAHIEALKAMLSNPSLRGHASPALMTLLSIPDCKEEAVRLALEWINEVGDAPAAQQLLARLLTTTLGGDAAVAAAIGWLRNVGSRDPRTPSVLSALLTTTRARKDVVTLAMEWVKTVGAESRAQQVLAALLRTTNGRDNDVIAATITWLAKAGTISGSQHVLAALLAMTRGREDVAASALGWLKQIGTDIGSEDVIRSLIAATNGREDVVTHALVWLDAVGTRPGSQHVVSALLTTTKARQDVNASALSWLKQVGTRTGSEDVLRSLITATNGRDDVVTQALSWLDAVGTRPGSQHVVSALLTTTGGRQDVVDSALRWLGSVGVGAGPEDVIRTLISVTNGRDDVVAQALSWLDAVGTRPGSQHVVSALLTTTGGRQDVVDSAIAWLNKVGTGAGSEDVIPTLLRATKGRDDVVEHAFAWLDADNSKDTIRILRPLARFAAHHPRVVTRVGDFLQTEPRVASRIQVLTALLHGSDSTGPGIKLLLEGKLAIDAGSRPSSDRIVYSASAANALSQVLQACEKNPSDARDLCFLISRASPTGSQTSLGEALLASKDRWPSECARYLWRPIILDRRVDPALYRDDLARWLEHNTAPGYSDIVRAIASRTDVDDALLRLLPSALQNAVHKIRETAVTDIPSNRV